MNIKKCKVGTLLCQLGRWAGEDLQKDTATLCSDARSQSKEEEGNMFHPVTTANDKLLWEVGDNQHNGIEIRNLKAFLLILMLLCSFPSWVITEGIQLPAPCVKRWEWAQPCQKLHNLLLLTKVPCISLPDPPPKCPPWTCSGFLSRGTG